MNHKARLILMPFAWLYGGFVYIRNKMFDRGILRSAQFEIPLICVGNLALGGTGKTPMVEMLVKMLKTKYCVATMSRGYKRKSKGFLVAGELTTTADIGDEPMQIHQKFPEITVSVAEERVMGIPQLLLKKPQTEVIILDDAFQHREVRAGLNILLTDCHHLYAEDRMLPAGNLRDVKSSSGRADIIVVTKCDAGMTPEERKAIERALDPLPQQKIFFSSIAYQQPYHLFSKQIAPLEQSVS